jgi:glycosyltransferase involved in cell wall biosynthesis
VTALAFRPDPPVTAVGVVVPARNEQDRIGRCLSSVRRALAEVSDGATTAVAMVLDRCTDATPERVASLVADWPQATVLTVPPSCSPDVTAIGRAGVRGSGVGALRDLGLRAVLDRLSGHPAAGTWLLSTDADTTVPPDWVRAHLQHAADGVHAVAGLADLAAIDHLAVGALWRYRAIVEHGLHGLTHHHVYGANLGVRADAYLAVGGFPADGSGEDHGLWQRLAAAGYTLVQPVGIRVRTSARLRGRAEGGLAGLLRALHRDDHQAGHRAGDAIRDGA